MNKEYKDMGKPVRKQDARRAGSLCAFKALVIGLTGGPATGKSTVAGILENLGAKVVSADTIVHRLLEPGSDVWRAVVHEFGGEVVGPDGSIDRKKLADIVFRDPKKRSCLEAIIHPPVLKLLAEEARRFRAGEKGILVLEIPLLIETSSLSLVNKVLVVTAEQETQISRLENRYHISREEAMLRIEAQLPMSEKLKYADWVVSTEGTLRRTRARVERVWRDIQKSLAHQE